MKKRVLFIDDEPYFQSIYGKQIQNAGYDVDFAENGEEALALIKENKYEILIVDLIMPIMSGLRFLENLKKEIKKYSVLVLTTLDSETDKLALEKLGVSHFLVKSDVDPSKLLEILETL